MLGGGTTVSRTYHNGGQQVEVQVITDSPLLQGMAALINSPMAAAAGMKTVVIGGRATSYSANDNSFMALVGGKTILKVAGNTMAAPMMQPNGTRFGGWLLNTADNVF